MARTHCQPQGHSRVARRPTRSILHRSRTWGSSRSSLPTAALVDVFPFAWTWTDGGPSSVADTRGRGFAGSRAGASQGRRPLGADGHRGSAFTRRTPGLAPWSTGAELCSAAAGVWPASKRGEGAVLDREDRRARIRRTRQVPYTMEYRNEMYTQMYIHRRRNGMNTRTDRGWGSEHCRLHGIGSPCREHKRNVLLMRTGRASAHNTLAAGRQAGRQTHGRQHSQAKPALTAPHPLAAAGQDRTRNKPAGQHRKGRQLSCARGLRWSRRVAGRSLAGEARRRGAHESTHRPCPVALSQHTQHTECSLWAGANYRSGPSVHRRLAPLRWRLRTLWVSSWAPSGDPRVRNVGPSRRKIGQEAEKKGQAGWPARL